MSLPWLLIMACLLSCSSSPRNEQTPLPDASHSRANVSDAAPPPSKDDASSAAASSCTALTQPGMNDCAAADAKRADADLDAVLNEVRARHRGDAKFLKKFNSANAAWTRFRDAELASIFAHSDDVERYPYGSMGGMCTRYAREAVTRQRIRDLQPWLVGVPSNEACTGEYPQQPLQ